MFLAIFMRAFPFLAQTVIFLRFCCFYHGMLQATGQSCLATNRCASIAGVHTAAHGCSVPKKVTSCENETASYHDIQRHSFRLVPPLPCCHACPAVRHVSWSVTIRSKNARHARLLLYPNASCSQYAVLNEEPVQNESSVLSFIRKNLPFFRNDVTIQPSHTDRNDSSSGATVLLILFAKARNNSRLQ